MDHTLTKWTFLCVFFNFILPKSLFQLKTSKDKMFKTALARTLQSKC